MRLLQSKKGEINMATYTGKFRTNYFSVTDKEKFKKMCEEIEAVYIEDDDKVGFYKQDSYGLWDETISFIAENLQPILDPEDACIITEVGSEAMRYFVACCTIITHTVVTSVDLLECADEVVKNILGNANWITNHSY